MKRTIVTILFLVAIAGLFWFFPLVHVVRLTADQPPESFDTAEFAKHLWSEKLMPHLENAAETGTVLAALRENLQSAGERYGRTVGVSRSRFYFLRGNGTIVSIDSDGVGVSLGDGSQPDVVLQTGLLFGNAVRDATGLVNASDFANSQAFNEISAELNSLVETRVIPSLKEQAQLGRRLRFVGCGEVRSQSTDLRPLKLVPLEVSFE